jgi:AraC family transcriptional regulator, transcriptional activator of pobA
MSEIQNVAFYKKNRVDIEIETIALEKLFARYRAHANNLCKEHRLGFYSVMLITKGSGFHRIDFHPYPYSEGSVIFVCKDQVHAFDSSLSSEGINLVFTEKFLTKNAIQSDVLTLHRLFNYHLHSPVIAGSEQEHEDLASVIQAMHAEYHSPESFGKEEVLRAWLRVLLVKTERIQRTLLPKGADSKWIDLFLRFKNAVEDGRQDSRNGRDYADRLGISYKHLNEACRTVIGKTPKEFIDSCLILEMKRQLSISTLSVKELTYQMGFDEPTNLVKYFKKHTGQTPAEFRAALLH